MLDRELLEGFVADSAEMLDQVEPYVIGLESAFRERSSIDKETLNAIFRLFHSLKGASAFLGLENITKVTHEAEGLLSALRDGRVRLEGRHVDVILEGCDFIREALAVIQKEGSDKALEVKAKALIDRIKQALTEGPREISEGVPERETSETPTETTQVQRELKRSDIRVDLEKLNELNDLIGELVIAETMVVRNPDLRGYRFENFEKAAHQLHMIVRSLQDLSMSLRMVPIGGLFRRMIRVVHDAAKRTRKEVELLIKGEETEVDKTVIEAIADPLVHLLRNAVDHGIEPPEERKRLGKPEKGKVELEARHEGGEVLITVRDDGRGLDREAILNKARERGLVEDGEGLPDEEVYKFIFLPGFSTAKEVTDVSGRGVGMDVVKSKVEELRGWVEVKSQKGQGTEITLHLPLTLAIIDGLLVEVGDVKYVLPLFFVKELFINEYRDFVVLPDGKVVIRHHERLLPVVALGEVFGVKGSREKEGVLVVIEGHRRWICLEVDEVLGQRDIVIKPLPRVLGRIKGISGCTILEDGTVSLILDVQGLMERFGLRAQGEIKS